MRRGEVCEGVVGATEPPEDGSGSAIDVGETVGIARGDEEVARLVLVDAVDVEEVPRPRLRLAVAFAAAEHLGEAEVLGGAPLEEQLARLDVDFLERAVVDPALLGTVFDGAQVRRSCLVDGEDGGFVQRDVELVQICRQAVGAADLVRFLVVGVELGLLTLSLGLFVAYE